MKTQISQLPATIHAPYSGVYQQQGRMISDADWNALSEVSKARLDDALADVIGSGTPERGGIIEGDESAGFRIVWGDVYVDGIRAELRQDGEATPTTTFAFDEQDDFPLPPSQPETPHRLYLDVWERSLTGLEEDVLIDPALNGADTTTRTRTMCQVKWGPDRFRPGRPGPEPAHRRGPADADPAPGPGVRRPLRAVP